MAHEKRSEPAILFLFGLDHFGSRRGDELAEVQIQALGLGKLQTDEGLVRG
jgi:hypothetical protein